MRPRLFTLAAAALLAGCGADSGVTPSNTPVSLDQVFKEMSLPAISGATSASGIDSPAALLSNGTPTGCSYVLASQSFVCAPITANGVTITQKYSLLNASGASLSIFEPTSLAAVRMQTTISGSESSDGDIFTLEGSQDQTLSGLQTSKHTLNGVTTLTLSGTSSAGTADAEELTLITKATTKDLVIPANAAKNAYPASGTIAIDETISLRSLPPFTTHIVLTFDGTSKVKVLTDGVSVPGCSTIDLSSATPGCS